MGPVIDQLSKRYHQLAADELARTLGKLDGVTEAEKAHLEDLTRRIVNKLLHDPITMLRQSENSRLCFAISARACSNSLNFRSRPMQTTPRDPLALF